MLNQVSIRLKIPRQPQNCVSEAIVAAHIQLARAQPHVLVLRALVAPFGDNLARRNLLARDVFEPRRGNPAGRVLRVRLRERLEERTRSLDVSAEDMSRQQNE